MNTRSAVVLALLIPVVGLIATAQQAPPPYGTCEIALTWISDDEFLVNTGDVDGDDVPNFADGFDLWDNDGADAGGTFAKLRVTVDNDALPSTAKLRFTYPASPPGDVMRDGPPNGPYRYSPAAGTLRIWLQDGMADRLKADPPMGDFVRPGIAYVLDELGAEHVFTLYVEGISPGAGVPIRAELALNGQTWACEALATGTVLGADVDGPGQFDDDPDRDNETDEELQVGHLVVLNDDDDSPADPNLNWDLEDPISSKVGDARLLPFVLSSSLGGQKVELRWAPVDRIAIYRENAFGDREPVANGVQFTPGGIPPLWIEGLKASSGMRDVNMWTLYHTSEGPLEADRLMLTVGSMDIRGDSNHDGAITDDDDEVEMDEDHAVILMVNDDDDNKDGTNDCANAVVDGASDQEDMTRLIAAMHPEGLPDAEVLLTGADNVRIFRKTTLEVVKPAAGDTLPPVNLWTNLAAGSDDLLMEGTAPGRSILTLTYRYQRHDGTFTEFSDHLQVLVMKVDMIAHRPTTEGPAYLHPFDRHVVPENQEETPGAGIRINGDSEGASRENDLIEIALGAEPPELAGLDYVLKRSNSKIKVWTSQKMTTALLDANDETNLPFGGTPMTLWVENPSGGAANLELQVRSRSGVVFCSDKVHFYPFTSIVIALGGETQNPSDPADADHGVFRLAIDLYEQGYDVHMYDEDTVDYSGAGVAYNEAVRAIRRRHVSQVAIYGYSHGGGSTFLLANLLNGTRATIGTAFTIPFTAYVDAVQDEFIGDNFRETRRPPSSGFHMNYYQEGHVKQDAGFDGGPLDNPAGDDFELDVDRPTPTETHRTIDDNEAVLDGIEAGIASRVTR